MGFNKEAWGTESGLLDAFDLKADDAWFGPNPESDFPDRIYLWLRGAAVIDGEIVDDEYTIRFSTGKNWEDIDGGSAVESATGSARFHQNSGMGELVTAVVGLIDEYPALEEALAERGDPTSAETWEGLAFSFERVEHTFKDRETGEETTYSRLVPVAFVEGGDKKKAAKKSAPKKAAAKKGGGDAALKRAIKKAAGDFEEEEFDEFVDFILDEDEFEQAGDISAKVKEWILDQDEGLWADLFGE